MRFSLSVEIDPENPAAIQSLLERLFVHDLAIILRHAQTASPIPALFHSGVIYRPEPNVQRHGERFDDIHTVRARGWGDCDDLAAWRAAELCACGVLAAPILVEVPGSRPGRRMYHCLVMHADGTIEDPCIVLGMR